MLVFLNDDFRETDLLDDLVDDRLRLTIGDNKLSPSVVHRCQICLARSIDRDQPGQIHFDCSAAFYSLKRRRQAFVQLVQPRTCQPAFELQPNGLLSCYER